MRTKQSGQFKAIVSAATLLALTAAAGPTTVYGASDTDADNTHQHAHYLDDGAWVNDIGTLLYHDDDGDGYFSGLSLSIDADSEYASYNVYAIIEITGVSDNSTGYQTELLHTTLPFHVYGRSASDEYRVDIDLVRNYSPGIYDLQVLLVDAHDNRILDVVDAFDFRNLRSLPLESSDNQSIAPPATVPPQNAPNDDIVVTEYAGSSGTAFVLLLMMGVLFRLRTRRQR